ncbi:hypothetical protein [Sorangium sp. So ce542]|uniref:hypothetical protein n=1 Tax=Sorangium sp. So ce542 TaxID=3133316 RepID=UPI003F646B2D
MSLVGMPTPHRACIPVARSNLPRLQSAIRLASCGRLRAHAEVEATNHEDHENREETRARSERSRAMLRAVARPEGAMNPPQNRYCERLGIAVPRVEDVAAQGTAKLFHLMIVALLERGGPMTLDEIAERLESAGVLAETGDLAHSLKKAWHGMAPVYRDATGHFGLDLDALALHVVMRATGLLATRAAPPPPAPAPPAPGDDVPLSAEELDAAFRDRYMTSLSWVRQAAAVLDARQEAMTAQQIESLLAALTKHRTTLGERNGPENSDLFVLGADGRLTLAPRAPGLALMRRAIRKLSRPELIRRAERAACTARIAARRAELDAEARRDAEIARRARRAVVRVVPFPEEPQAAAVLDVGQRSIRTFLGRDMAELAGALERFDVIAGLHIRDTLLALGLDADRRRVVDLRPPKKSRRLNRAGRILEITPELLIAGTTGISRPLGDPEKVASYLAEGDHAKLARRLESDVKALHAFYQYGVLHGFVRLRWGFIDEVLSTEWALPGDVSLYQQLKSASETGAAVDLVVGAAPGWADPWSRARRVRVLDICSNGVLVAEGEGRATFAIARDEIQAVRLAPEHTGPSARRAEGAEGDGAADAEDPAQVS